MSKFFKGIAKVAKKIGKGIKKVFKKVVKSKIFKIALVAVAVYFGGAALGLWGGAGGAAATTAAAVAPAAVAPGAVATTAAAAAAPAAAATTGVAATTGAGLATVAETSAALTAAAPVAATTGAGIATASEVAGALTATEAVAAPSLLAQVGAGAKAVGTFMQANPIATTMAMQGVSSALAPDEGELMQEQEEIRRREFEADLASRRSNLTGYNTLPLLHQARDARSLRSKRLGG